MSFIYIRKGHGPRTEPWGTPDNTGQLFDVWPSTTTLWNLCDNHAPIQFDVFLFIPIRFNLRISLWWSTLSKALEKSITATSVCLPLAMLSKISWVNVRERPFNLKGGVWFFFLKKYSDSKCCWKKYSDFDVKFWKIISRLAWQKKNSTSCVVRKKNSERNKKP